MIRRLIFVCILMVHRCVCVCVCERERELSVRTCVRRTRFSCSYKKRKTEHISEINLLIKALPVITLRSSSDR